MNESGPAHCFTLIEHRTLDVGTLPQTSLWHFRDTQPGPVFHAGCESLLVLLLPLSAPSRLTAYTHATRAAGIFFPRQNLHLRSLALIFHLPGVSCTRGPPIPVPRIFTPALQFRGSSARCSGLSPVLRLASIRNSNFTSSLRRCVTVPSGICSEFPRPLSSPRRFASCLASLKRKSKAVVKDNA